MAMEKAGNSGSGSPGGPTGAETLKNTTNFLQETIVELKKTTWPTKRRPGV